MAEIWGRKLRIDEIPEKGKFLRLSAAEADRARIARNLDLVDLSHLEAELKITPWFDGVEIAGRWSAALAQACIVTLERLDSELSGQFVVRIVPEGSDLAADHTGDIDPDADDPPDITEDGEFHPASYVIEHLSLELDPYPRKEGAEYQPPAPDRSLSPFAVLKDFKKT